MSDDLCPCGEDDGGSHYHCANCGVVSSMVGHYEGDGTFRCPPESERPSYAKEFACSYEDAEPKTERILRLLGPLNFDEIRDANVARLPEFKNSRGLPAHSIPDGSDWTPLEWGGAAAGEAGEMCNYLKKLRRGDVTLDDIDQKEKCTIRQAVGREIADTILYLDHVANQLGIDLSSAIREKFNRVSDKIGSKVTL